MPYFRQHSSRLLVLALCIFLTQLSLPGCDQATVRQQVGKPLAQGAPGELLLVADSTTMAGPVGQAFRQAFAPPLPGTLIEEPALTVIQINPFQFNDLWRRHKNIVILTSMERTNYQTQRLKQFFNKESLDLIAKDKSRYLFAKNDEFARGQLVMFLFSQSDNLLVQNLTVQGPNLRKMFEDLEVKRLKAKYLTVRADEGRLEKKIAQEHGFQIPLPKGYQLANSTKNSDGQSGFVWVRFPEYEVDRNLLVAYRPYVSEDQFKPDSIFAWRERICKAYLYGDPANPESVMLTETLQPPAYQSTVLNQQYNYAQEMRGLWKTKNISMGGLFVSYTFADPKKGRLYYAEGFVYAPARDYKREFLREFETVIKSIQ
ncbi:MAG: DUF4837 family protein [Bernardetiaceae bacterium]|jgi:hypothetical protein|nr:DUF4837 family protein [Bernardetiaceae bacterium]